MIKIVIEKIKEKFIFKILAIVFVIIIIFMLLTLKDFVSSKIKLKNISEQVAKVKIADDHDFSRMGKSYKDNIYEKYDTVKFGKYYQSAIHKIKTPIDWIVLAKEDDKALLISKYILDCKPFNNKYKKECHWNDSTIRKWLNEDFYNIAFNNTEKDLIIESELENKKDIGRLIGKNENKALVDSENTFDKVFLLSDAEFVKYFTANRYYCDEEFWEEIIKDNIKVFGESNSYELDGDFDNATTCGTPYAYKNGLKNATLESTANYWLRTTADKNDRISFINYEGWDFTAVVTFKMIGIRPAIWVSLKD